MLGIFLALFHTNESARFSNILYIYIMRGGGVYVGGEINTTLAIFFATCTFYHFCFLYARLYDDELHVYVFELNDVFWYERELFRRISVGFFRWPIISMRQVRRFIAVCTLVQYFGPHI